MSRGARLLSAFGQGGRGTRTEAGRGPRSVQQWAHVLGARRIGHMFVLRSGVSRGCPASGRLFCAAFDLQPLRAGCRSPAMRRRELGWTSALRNVPSFLSPGGGGAFEGALRMIVRDGVHEWVAFGISGPTQLTWDTSSGRGRASTGQGTGQHSWAKPSGDSGMRPACGPNGPLHYVARTLLVSVYVAAMSSPPADMRERELRMVQKLWHLPSNARRARRIALPMQTVCGSADACCVCACSGPGEGPIAGCTGSRRPQRTTPAPWMR